MSEKTTIYTLNNQDQIISVRGAWDEFAEANGGKELSESNILGRSIWDFINDDTTRMWLDTVFQLARVQGEVIERPYRCDSPELKRFMMMSIVPEQDGVLYLEHKLMSVDPRQVPLKIHYSATPEAGVRQRCSMCGQLNIKGKWQEPRHDFADISDKIYVVYTICESCEDQAVADSNYR